MAQTCHLELLIGEFTGGLPGGLDFLYFQFFCLGFRLGNHNKFSFQVIFNQTALTPILHGRVKKSRATLKNMGIEKINFK